MLGRIGLTLTIAVLSLVVIAWQSGAIPTYGQICADAADHSGQKNCSAYYAPLVWLWHVGEFLEGHGEAVIAVFTVVLAASTTLLWDATRKLFSVTEKMAMHIPTVERAWIFGGPAAESVEGTPELLRFKIGIKNHGKTPGFVKVIWGGLSREEPFNPVPTYDDGLRIDTDCVFSAGEYMQWPEWFGSTPNTRFFFGYVRYTDIFGDIHVSRFCVRFVPEKGKFVLAGHPAWNAHYTEPRES